MTSLLGPNETEEEITSSETSANIYRSNFVTFQKTLIFGSSFTFIFGHNFLFSRIFYLFAILQWNFKSGRQQKILGSN